MIIIYSITNIITNKKYIGVSQEFNIRKRKHMWALENNRHDNEKLQNAFLKYGKESFKFEILEELKDTSTRICVLERENFYILHFDSYKNGYNKSIGFEGSTLQTKSDEFKQKMSDKWKGNTIWLGRTQTKEHIQKRTKNQKGKIVSESTKQKLSDSAKLKIGNKNPFYGKHHTEIAKKKIAIKLGQKVMCIETGIIYPSLIECARQLDIDRCNLRRVCNGKAKSLKKFTFKYVK